MAHGVRRLQPEPGTRFRLFPQAPFLKPYRVPEIVSVSSAAGTIGPGPSDHRMYAIDPIGKRHAYGEAGEAARGLYLLPPWPGAIYPPAEPDRNGHFDHIGIDAPEFEAVHLFGTVRRTLDVWEGYFGQRIDWHFADTFDRLELVLQRNLFENAYMGYGFLEVGYHRARDGKVYPFSLNFDVVAHEVGHCIVYSTIGVPDPGADDGEYYGFHESAADLMALVTALNFDTVLDELLASTRGNLYALNFVNRIAELSDNEQIRLAANSLTLFDFAAGWHDEHELAQPMTGMVFDILVDIFHEELVGRGLISHSAEDLSDRLAYWPDYDRVIQPIFDTAYAAAPEGFRDALVAARDTVGIYLAETWRRLSPDNLAYADVGAAMLVVDRLLTGGRYRRIIEVNLRLRGIGLVAVGPRLEPHGAHHHFNLSRVFVPAVARGAGQRTTPLRARTRRRRTGSFGK